MIGCAISFSNLEVIDLSAIAASFMFLYNHTSEIGSLTVSTCVWIF